MLIFTRPGNPSGERCDLPRLLEEALLLVKSDVDAAGVRCLIRVDPVLEALEGGPVVQGDRDQTVRVFVNVLKNAVQAVAGFRPRGTGVVEALVRPLFPPPAPGRHRDSALGRGTGAPRSSRRPSGPDSIEVDILDNGPGVTPERMERLFVPFYTEKQGGIGLGLYIVHSLMERQGGRVDLENRTEGGLLVRLLFAASGAAGDVPGTSGAGGASLGEDAASMAAAEVRRPSNG
jgi:signal transduction histidine kinase